MFKKILEQIFWYSFMILGFIYVALGTFEKALEFYHKWNINFNNSVPSVKQNKYYVDIIDYVCIIIITFLFFRLLFFIGVKFGSKSNTYDETIQGTLNFSIYVTCFEMMYVIFKIVF